MVTVDTSLCVGCGKCVVDCVSGRLVLRDGKAVYRKRCIQCGHCVAICPVNAVSMPEYDMEDVEEYDASTFDIDPKHMLRAIKFRRSIREFVQRPVEKEKLCDIVNAGRCSATASNRQDFRFVVVQDRLAEYKKIIWDILEKQLEDKVNMPSEMLRPFSRFLDMRRKDPTHDYLFRNATVAVFIESGSELDAGIAAQNMELTAVAHGLGVLYDQYLAYATKLNRDALRWLGISSKKFIVAMLMGYPGVKYYRTAPRRILDVSWR